VTPFSFIDHGAEASPQHRLTFFLLSGIKTHPTILRSQSKRQYSTITLDQITRPTSNSLHRTIKLIAYYQVQLPNFSIARSQFN